MLLTIVIVVLISKVFLKIRQKWPRWFFATPHDRSVPIIVQQDNARPHTLTNDTKIVAAGRTAGFDIRMAQQPANSPDYNVLNLGLFNAIDKLQHKKPRRNIEELIGAVQYAFDTLPPDVINRAFVSFQGVLEQIILTDGSNNFAMPHMKKRQTEKKCGELPFKHHLSGFARRKAKKHLREQRKVQHIAMWGEDDSDVDNVSLLEEVQETTPSDYPPLVGEGSTTSEENNNSAIASNNNNTTSSEVVMVAQRFTL